MQILTEFREELNENEANYLINICLINSWIFQPEKIENLQNLL